MKSKCDSTKCPIPVCKLPGTLTALQIKTIMTFMQMGYKVIAIDLKMSPSRIYQVLNYENKNPTRLKNISDYVREKFIENLNQEKSLHLPRGY